MASTKPGAIHYLEMLQRLGSVIAGVVIGYLVWAAYYHVDLLPSALVVGVIHGTKWTIPYLGVDAARHVAIAVAVIMQAAPGSVSLGIGCGLVLPRLRSPRWFVYSVILFPVAVYIATATVLWQFAQPPARGLTQWLSQAAAEHAQVGFAVYALFFLALFAAYTIARRFKRHDNPTQPTAGRGG